MPKRDYGSERQIENERWLWTLKWRQIMALNAKMKCGFERWNKDVTLNSEMRMWLWTPKWEWGSEHQNVTTALNAKLRRNGGSKRQTKSNSYECWAKTTTLNAKLNWIIVNVKLRMTTLNVVIKKTWWLRMPNHKEMMGEICPNVVCCHNSQSTEKV